MPEEFVGITYINRPRFAENLTLQIPDSVVTDADGNIIPGRRQTFKFTKGKYHPNVPVALANELLEGPTGVLKQHVYNGEVIYERAFVLGDHTKKNQTQTLSQQVTMLEDQLKALTPLVEALAKSGAIDPAALKALGIAAPAEEDDDDDVPPMIPVSDPSKFGMNKGSYMADEHGALLCPYCQEFSTLPISPEYPEATARRSITMHMAHCKKKLDANTTGEG